jgi:penicillin-binding protein 1B
VSFGMYLWALETVRGFLRERGPNSQQVMSDSSAVASVDAEASHNIGELRALSIPTWRKLLAAHEYAESDSLGPRTFSIDTKLNQVRVMQPNGSVFIADGSGSLRSGETMQSLTRAQRVSLAPVPLGSRKSTSERASLAVPLNAFSRPVRDAVVAVEDERFYAHFGLDLIGIARAVVVNFSAGAWVQGGSTLTQQIAKNAFLNSERSLTRKFKELFLSLALESELTKDELLELYLNEVYLGSIAGNPVRGIPAAARWLLGKSPHELSISESALLAGMIHAPSINNPRTHATNAEERRRVAIRRMLDAQLISERQFREALAEKPRIVPVSATLGNTTTFGLAPFVVALAKDQAPEGATQTTISPPLQRCAELAVASATQRLARRLKRTGTQPQIGFVAIDVWRSATVAVVGGTNFAVNRIDHATKLTRQLGSTVKPFVYLRAFERGLTLASSIDDQPLPNGKWNPENFDRRYRGEVTARYALENSLNLPAIRVAKSVGLPEIARTFAEFGIVSKATAAYPALAVGALEGTLLDLTNGYAALARGGAFSRAQLFESESATGLDVRTTRIADPRATFLVTNALQGVVLRGTARGLDAGSFPSIAGKTGTSDSTRDAWFAGYTPTHALGVWIGYDDNRPLGLTGGAAATPLVGDFLRCGSELIPRLKFTVPDGIELLPIDRNNSAEDSIKEFFISANAQAQPSALPDRTKENRSSHTSWLERLFN